jgi:hypothetical protein
MNLNTSHVDDISLLKIIKYLCTSRIRHPMTIEQTKAWLKQFSPGSEKTLALLILRYLIYRTTSQLDSSFKQALKAAAISFIPIGYVKENIDWRDVLNGKDADLDFYFGPPKHAHSPPGKSGEIVSRQLKFCDLSNKFKLSYTDQFTSLKPNERYLLIDDGSFTGDQFIVFIKSSGQILLQNNQSGIVVGLAHESAIKALADAYPTIPLFCGERITSQECFEVMANNWIEDGMWPYPDITPFEQYMEIVDRAKFTDKLPLGYGSWGCMVAYEHGVPDNSLQLLWDKSTRWNPLFVR